VFFFFNYNHLITKVKGYFIVPEGQLFVQPAEEHKAQHTTLPQVKISFSKRGVTAKGLNSIIKSGLESF